MRVRRDAVRVLAVAGAAILSLPLTPTAARAQNVPLAQLLPDLILREILVQSPTTGLPTGSLSHVAHFSPIEANELNNPVVGIVESFNTQMATQFSTFPLGSSTGGLTYVFDESVGTFRRGSASFGPLFAERALTIGRRKLSAGFNYQRTSYNTFEGQNLDDGSIKFYLRHQDCCTFNLLGPNTLASFLQPNGTRLNPPFEGDLIEAALSLKATTHTTAVFANYGVTDHWDIGLAVPFVRVNLDASVRARILRLVTATNPDVHTFEIGNPDATRTVQRTGHASGLGDIVLRTKYHFLRMAGGGLAAAVDLRLPTGDENELLGTGGTEAKFLLVASSERGRFGQHVNLGYTAAEGEVAGTLAGLTSAPIPDEINYSGGVEFVASPRLTVMGDVVGRTLRRAGRLDLVSKTFEYNAFSPTTPGPDCGFGSVGFVCASTSLDEFAPRSGDLTLLLGTGGVKFNLTGNLLLSGSVLFPLTNAGLRSRLTTVIGVDYAF
jgi:outer membrane putative beta-barrel porin/alpha-amylase